METVKLGDAIMSVKEKKGSKNVVSEKDMDSYILQTRKVFRNGMIAETEYDLKIPKTSKSFIDIYGEGELIRLAVASLKTENDDAIETSGKPISEEKKFKSALKSASNEQREAIAKILGLSIEDAGRKFEEMKKEYKKHGIGK